MLRPYLQYAFTLIYTLTAVHTCRSVFSSDKVDTFLLSRSRGGMSSTVVVLERISKRSGSEKFVRFRIFGRCSSRFGNFPACAVDMLQQQNDRDGRKDDYRVFGRYCTFQRFLQNVGADSRVVVTVRFTAPTSLLYILDGWMDVYRLYP